MRLAIFFSACLLFLGALLSPMGAAKAASNVPISVKAVSVPQIKKAIADRKGKVVVVNFWATWCAPCVAEFPDLVKLQSAYKDKDVVVISISANDVSEIKPDVLPFLTKSKAYFDNYLIKATDPDVFINAFDPKWQGDIPRTFVYDKRGILSDELAGMQTYASFRAAVDKALKK
jgi:thiol-disulfide isomerase/thioredoxin